MEIAGNRTPAPYRFQSLVEFLIGDGVDPGWLDEQSRHSTISLAQRSPGHCGKDLARGGNLRRKSLSQHSDPGGGVACPPS